MYWWQWILQITGAWFYLGLLFVCLWIVIRERLIRRHNSRRENFRRASHQTSTWT